jgi:hypothetical protein
MQGASEPALAHTPWPRRVLIVALALGVGLLVPGCGDQPPNAVSLATLVAEADAFDGRLVLTAGVVREFDETDALEHHFVIEDAAQNRVQLMPNSAVQPHVDAEVAVVGVFTFDEETGRRIEVDGIERR